MFHVWPRLRIKPSLNQLMKKLAELPFGGIKHPLAFLLTNSSWVQVFTIALGALAGWKLQAIRQAKFQNCALEYPKLLRGLVVLLNARTDCASQHNNHCFRLRQPVSLAIVKRVPQQDWHVSRLLYSGANRPHHRAEVRYTNALPGFSQRFGHDQILVMCETHPCSELDTPKSRNVSVTNGSPAPPKSSLGRITPGVGVILRSTKRQIACVSGLN